MNLKKVYGLLVLFTIVLGACSPKIRTPKPETSKPVEKEKPVDKKPVKKFSQASVSRV